VQYIDFAVMRAHLDAVMMPAGTNNLTIMISRNGYMLDSKDEIISVEELNRHLARLAQLRKKLSVVCIPDDTVLHEDVMRVMGMCRKLGLDIFITNKSKRVPLFGRQGKVLSEKARRLYEALTKGILTATFHQLPRETNAVDLSQCEVISIPSPPAISDAFSHTIYLNSQTDKYWMLRTGGIAGVRELYGPGNANEVK
jgi:hypothetical protein